MAVQEGERLAGSVILYSPESASRLKEVNGAVITAFPLYAVLIPEDLDLGRNTIVASLDINPDTLNLTPFAIVSFRRVFLPESMIPEDQRGKFETVWAISDGMRTCTIIPDRKLHTKFKNRDGSTDWEIANPIRLSDIGVRGDDSELTELPTLGIKGSGTVFEGLSPDDEAVYSLVDEKKGATTKLRRFISHLAPLGPIVLPRLLQDEERDTRAVGGSSLHSAKLNLHTTQQLIERKEDLKFFPAIFGIPLPSFAIREMLRHAHEAGIERNFGRRAWEKKHNVKTQGQGFKDEFTLAQTIRLSFSQVRGRGFTEEEFDLTDAALRFQALDFDPRKYREIIAPRYRRDFRRMFDAYTRFQETSIEGIYTHIDFGETHFLEEMGEEEFEKYDIAYYFTKDLALAQTGVYIADLDALDVDAKIFRDHLAFCTRRFTAELFKEWINLMTHLRIASSAVEGNPVPLEKYGEIEREEYKLLLEELQNSSTSKIQDRRDRLIFTTTTLNGKRQPTGTHFETVIEKRLLHMQYQG